MIPPDYPTGPILCHLCGEAIVAEDFRRMCTRGHCFSVHARCMVEHMRELAPDTAESVG